MSAEQKEFLPISVIVCTFNEEKNISECLDSILANKPKEVFVIDGGSKDSTVKIVEKKKVVLNVCSQKGLVFQRAAGLNLVTQPYVAFVDADNFLDTDCFSILIKEMEENSFVAIQAPNKSYSLETYWEQAMQTVQEFQLGKPGQTKMVGRPAIHKTEVLKELGFDQKWGKSFNEDTDLAIRHERHNYKVGLGTGSCRIKHPKTLKKWLRKWRIYGSGDANIIKKHPKKIGAILKHQFFNYPIKYSFLALKKGCPQYIPFYILYGFFRFIFMIDQFLFRK